MCAEGHHAAAVRLLVGASSEPDPRLGCEAVRLLTGLVTSLAAQQVEDAELLASSVIPALRLAAQVTILTRAS